MYILYEFCVKHFWGDDVWRNEQGEDLCISRFDLFGHYLCVSIRVNVDSHSPWHHGAVQLKRGSLQSQWLTMRVVSCTCCEFVGPVALSTNGFATYRLQILMNGWSCFQPLGQKNTWKEFKVQGVHQFFLVECPLFHVSTKIAPGNVQNSNMKNKHPCSWWMFHCLTIVLPEVEIMGILPPSKLFPLVRKEVLVRFWRKHSRL